MKLKNFLLLLFIHISLLTNSLPQDLILRRVFSPYRSILIQDFTVPLIVLLTEKFREIDGIDVIRTYQDCSSLIEEFKKLFSPTILPEFRGVITEAWKASLRIGFILAMVKDIRELELEKLDIYEWMEENSSLLLEKIPEFKKISEITSEPQKLISFLIEKLKSIPFEQLKHIYKDSASLRYQGFENAIINYYFLTFVQNASSISELPADDIACDLLVFEEILKLHRFREIKWPGINLPSDYCPDLWLLGEQKEEIRKREIEEYLLDRLIEFQLLGYAQCFIGEKEKQRLASNWNEKEFLEALDAHKFDSEIKRFIEEHYPYIRRIVWSAFNFRPHFTHGQPLIDTLPISLAEDIVRKIISLYFKNFGELKNSPAYGSISDPFYYLNRIKNDYAYRVWGKYILKKIEIIKGRFDNPEDYYCEKAIVEYLFKILTIAGVFDLSVDTIRKRIEEEGFMEVIEECLNPRTHPFIVRSFNKFFEEVVFNKEKKTKLVIYADNNGEIIYLLGVIQYLLEINPNLYIFLVPRGVPVADDVYYRMVVEILREDSPELGGKNYFAFLRNQFELFGYGDLEKRFHIVENGPDIQGVDLNCLGEDTLTKIFLGIDRRGKKVFCDRIVCLFIGNANFVSTQGLDVSLQIPVDRYYLFRVKSDRVSEATGIPKEPPRFIEYPLVFAYVEPGVCIGTSFGERVYPTLLEYEREKGEYFDPLDEPLKSLKLEWIKKRRESKF